MTRQIQLGGQPRPILFKLQTIKIYQQLTGKNLLKEDLGKLFTEQLEAESICALVYAVLVTGAYPAKPDFTVEDVENWLGLDTAVFTEIIQAYLDFIPGARTVKPDESPNPIPPQPEGV